MLCKINVVKIIKVLVELKLERVVTINCNILYCMPGFLGHTGCIVADFFVLQGVF